MESKLDPHSRNNNLKPLHPDSDKTLAVNEFFLSHRKTWEGRQVGSALLDSLCNLVMENHPWVLLEFCLPGHRKKWAETLV